MTRRSFLADMLKCGIATTFLPGAGRIWKPDRMLCGGWDVGDATNEVICLLSVPKKLHPAELVIRDGFAIYEKTNVFTGIGYTYLVENLFGNNQKVSLVAVSKPMPSLQEFEKLNVIL